MARCGGAWPGKGPEGQPSSYSGGVRAFGVVTAAREKPAPATPAALAFVEELAALYAELWTAGKLGDICHSEPDASREDE
jgi:hypothetical protein